MASSRIDGLIASTFGRSRHVLVGRGTTALALALRALGLEGARVGVPASVCYAVPLAVELSGNEPVFLDADPSTGNVTAAELDRIGRPDAVVAVSTLYGAPLALAEIAAWCERQGVTLVEDPSLAVGDEIDGRPAGGWGQCAIVSFGAGKTVDVGNGAAVVTDDDALARDVERLAAELPPHTSAVDDALVRIALAYREQLRRGDVTRSFFDDERAAFLYAAPAGIEGRIADALAALPAAAAERHALSAAYADELGAHELVRPLTPAGSPAWRYSLRALRGRNAALERLWAAGEDASAWYPSAAPVFGDRSGYAGAETIEREVVNLWLTGRDEQQARRTARTLVAALEEAA